MKYKRHEFKTAEDFLRYINNEEEEKQKEKQVEYLNYILFSVLAFLTICIVLGFIYLKMKGMV